MSLEARYLANKINAFNLESETSPDDKIYYEGLNQYENIKRDITFILPRGLKLIPDMLDDNGKKVYEKLFRKILEKEIIKQSK